jgi:hypothetical protein
MEKELLAQIARGGLTSCTSADSMGRVRISGDLDLAGLALVTEAAMRREFGL